MSNATPTRRTGAPTAEPVAAPRDEPVAAPTDEPVAAPTDEPVEPTWEEVARSQGAFLYNLAYRLTADRDDAEDLVQETLLRVRKGLPGYQPGSMRGWLTRIATNAFIDQMRRRRLRPESTLTEDAERDLPLSPAADDAARDRSLDADLQRALMALPPEYRLPVVLCDVADRSYQEIADALGLPIGTVRSRIHRGRLMLRKVLG